MPTPIAIGIHGGCGTLDRAQMPDAEWAEAREHLSASLKAGWEVLKRGGRALDAVEAAIVVMEESPHFNAGYGAAINADGIHELDASIMDGETLGAGAVAGARRIRNPIKAARAVMERSPSVLLAGSAADGFAEHCGLAMVDNSFFTTERRVKALASLKQREKDGTFAAASEGEKHGTVGAVALDKAGHLAAGTSTGGFNNKPPGRVGDSPIIGAGTYARDGVCAVSGTGQGELFIRHVLAYDIAARMMYAGESLDHASDLLINKVMRDHKVGAGCMAIDAKGRVLAPFNTLGMYRGWIMADGRIVVGTHGEEHGMGTIVP
jgi:beta-aspartyl-peptidase (threonine type)